MRFVHKSGTVIVVWQMHPHNYLEFANLGVIISPSQLTISHFSPKLSQPFTTKDRNIIVHLSFRELTTSFSEFGFLLAIFSSFC